MKIILKVELEEKEAFKRAVEFIENNSANLSLSEKLEMLISRYVYYTEHTYPHENCEKCKKITSDIIKICLSFYQVYMD